MRTDEDLARDFRGGDDGALAALYDRYRRPLYGFCARMLGSSEEARDAVQDVFLGIHERRGGPERLRSFRAWLFTLGRNHCLSRIRQRRTRARLDEVVASEAAGAVPAATIGADEEALVRRALAELPEEQREVLILREYQDLSYREIAEVTETTESAVKSKLFRARQTLCERLRPVLTGGDEPCGAKTRDSD